MAQNFNVSQFPLEDDFIPAGGDFDFGEISFEKVEFRIINAVEVNGFDISDTYSFLNHEIQINNLIFVPKITKKQ